MCLFKYLAIVSFNCCKVLMISKLRIYTQVYIQRVVKYKYHW